MLCSVPGKPPRNITALASSPTSITITWEPEKYCEVFLTTRFKILYKHTGDSNFTVKSVDVDNSKSSFELTELDTFVNYTVWLIKVTTRGLGIASQKTFVRTLEEGRTLRMNSLFYRLKIHKYKLGINRIKCKLFVIK